MTCDVDAGTTTRSPLALAVPASRIRLGVGALLAAIVSISFVARLAAAWLRPTPTYFPDEYLYTELGRSLAESGQPLVRGASASFPALLQPLLTAPAWLFGDVETSFRVIQAIGVLSMSLAAVPAYLLARRVGVGTRLALGVAAIAVAAPSLLYGSWILAEPFAYPLVLGAIAAGVAALERPRIRTQLAFVALAGLAIFCRAQFAVLPVAYLAAVGRAGAARAAAPRGRPRISSPSSRSSCCPAWRCSRSARATCSASTAAC